MRARLILLVAATTSLVLVAFLVPLALSVRSTAADRALTAAAAEVHAAATIVATAGPDGLDEAVSRINSAARHPVTVFLADGRTVGPDAPRSATVGLAASGRSLTAPAPGGREVLVAVAGLANGTSVVRAFVPDAELRRGVGRAWLLLGLLGAGLLVVSVLVADQLGRGLTRPLTDVAEVAYQLAKGDLTARAGPDGPETIRQVAVGLNLLAERIGELLAAEREAVADLSHRLRTPLTALRIDAESLSDDAERARIATDLDEVERTVNAIVWQARRPVRHDIAIECDAAAVVADRVRFWSLLAVEEQRVVDTDLADQPVPVRAGQEDLAACVDALLGNVFAHTPPGCGLAVRLTRRPGGGALLVVSDDGPGLPGPQAAERGRSGSGSTGLGLDIVRRVATGSGGRAVFGNGPAGGARIVVELGPPAQVVPGQRRASIPATRSVRRMLGMLGVRRRPGR